MVSRSWLLSPYRDTCVRVRDLVEAIFPASALGRETTTGSPLIKGERSVCSVAWPSLEPSGFPHPASFEVQFPAGAPPVRPAGSHQRQRPEPVHPGVWKKGPFQM